MYQKKRSKICRKLSNGRFENILYFRSVSGIGKSYSAKDYKKINIRNGKSKNFVLYCSTAKHGKAYDFIDSEYKARYLLHIWWYWCKTSFGFKSFQCFDRDMSFTKISSRYTNAYGFLIMQLLQRLHQLKIDW